MGDILNIIGLETKELAYIFRKFEPVERFIISRDSAQLNSYFSIVKGQLIDLYYFATIGPMENDQPEDFSEDVTVNDVVPEVLQDEKPKRIRKKTVKEEVLV